MKRILISISLILKLALANAQYYDRVWLTGGGGVNISTFDKVAVKNTLYIDSVLGWGIYYIYGHSNICDREGTLQFGCDGMNIYHKNHHFMEGGYKLVPDKLYQKDLGTSLYSQSSIILPITNTKYFVFTSTASDNQVDVWNRATNTDSTYFDMLTYHIVDMNANNGMGKVAQSQIPILQNGYLALTQMMACRHANGRDWWLLKARYNGLSFHAFLVTDKGVEDYGIQWFPSNGLDYDWESNGQSVFSPDGTMFATVVEHRQTVNLFDFDRCTGKLSNQRAINMPKQLGGNPNDTSEIEFASTVGVAFSPNQKFLYVSSKYNIMQYELNATDSASAYYHVANLDTTWERFMGYSNMYVGPNGRLYIGNWHGISKEMSVINKPNEKGVNCAWCPRCFRLPYYTTAPPCMPNYHLGALQGSACDTIGKVQSTDIAIYPNPSSGQVQLYIPYAMGTAIQVQLIDMLGQVILKKDYTLNSKQEVLVNLSQLAKGTYILKVTSNTKEYIRKITKE